MAGSARPPETSLMMWAPASMAASAVAAWMVSTETMALPEAPAPSALPAPSARSARTTGRTREISVSMSTLWAPGRVDSPPTSMMSAPWAMSSRAWATAASGSAQRPPSEKESGVTLRTPMRSVRSRGTNPGRGAGAAAGRFVTGSG